MKKPEIIIAIGLFLFLIWLYSTNRISGFFCWILCTILFAITFAADSTVKILSLGTIMGAALGIMMMSEKGGTMCSNTGVNAVEAIETATQRFISVSNTHGQKLKLEIVLNILKIMAWIVGLSGFWSAIHHWLRHF